MRSHSLTCEIASHESVALDAVVDGLEITAQDVLDRAVGTWSGWYDGDFTDAGVLTEGSMTVSPGDGSAEVVHQERVFWRDAEGGGSEEVRDSASPECPTHFEIPASAALEADGGTLDEDFALALTATTLDDVGFAVELPYAELGGTATPPWSDDLETTMLTLSGLVTEVPAGHEVFGGSARWSLPLDPETGEEHHADLGGFSFDRVTDG